MHSVDEGELRSASRFGGGNYRRPGRWYDSTICMECIVGLVAGRTEPDYAGQLVSRWPLRRLIEHAKGAGS